jgi:hypothetical protein
VSTAADLAPAAPAPGPSEEKALHVFLACGAWTLAFPAEGVTRLLGLEDAPPLQPSPAAAPEETAAHLGLLVVEGRVHSAWDLGGLLGLQAPAEAWLLLRQVVGGQAHAALALRTGACLSVGPLPPRTERLPATLSREPGLFGQAFVAEGIGRGRTGLFPVGLRIEPVRLFGPAEDAAVALDLAAAPNDE